MEGLLAMTGGSYPTLHRLKLGVKLNARRIKLKLVKERIKPHVARIVTSVLTLKGV
jgi:hypothetical protein